MARAANAVKGSGDQMFVETEIAEKEIVAREIADRTRAETEDIFDRFHDMVTGPADSPAAEEEVAQVGKLAVFSGVREFPMRVKCATLAWHTLRAAMKNDTDPVTTEQA